MSASMQELDSNLHPQRAADGLAWYDLRELGIEGQGWQDVDQPFDRLPARAEKCVTPAVWGLAQRTAGLRARFVTNATSIAVRCTLRQPKLELAIMPASGASGVDLYAWHENRWRFVGASKPLAQEYNQTVIADMTGELRHFMLNLPLYNGVVSIEIGLPEGSMLRKAPAYPVKDQRPVCFYGTSINQGGCTSRAGMNHIAILQRRLNRPVLNLGFAGSARCEPEIADLLAELDPVCYVLDPASNMQRQMFEERLQPMVQKLRKARPATPILIVGCIQYTDAWISQPRAEKYHGHEEAILHVYQNLIAQGMKHLHYLPGSALLSGDDDATVDGVHPTDLGFVHLADAIEPVLRRMLEPIDASV